MPILTATVSQNEPIAAATREVILETSSPFAFQPGQYITILVPTEPASLGQTTEARSGRDPGVKESVLKKIGRSYSIASEPTDTRIVLVVKIVPGGLGSTYIENWREGDRVEFLGPLGRFLLPSLPLRKEDGGMSDFLFVATGAGIAPFVPMIDTILQQPVAPRITLLLGFRHREDAMYVDRFTEWERRNGNFRFICCLSQPDEAWPGEKGRVTAYIKDHPGLTQNAWIYICGNGSMINDVSMIAQEHGVPREKIFLEKYNNL